MAIVFLPLLEEKAFICFQNPFKGLYSPETAHAKHKTHSHLNLPIEEKAIKFIKSIKAFFFLTDVRQIKAAWPRSPWVYCQMVNQGPFSVTGFPRQGTEQ